MSKKSVQAFLDAVDTNAELRSELAGPVEQVVKIGKKYNYRFSPTELREALSKRWGITDAPNYNQDPLTCFFVG